MPKRVKALEEIAEIEDQCARDAQELARKVQEMAGLERRISESKKKKEHIMSEHRDFLTSGRQPAA